MEAYIHFHDIIGNVNFYTGTITFMIGDVIFKMYITSVILCMHHEVFFL